jgi:GNAT superfamily N-acetyltransferase
VQCKDDFIEECRQFLNAGMDRGDWTFWVAKDGARIVSNIFVHTIPPMPSPALPNDRYGYVTNVYTVPDRRNEGIGTELMARAVRWAREIGISYLFVWPSQESVTLYQRAGFSFCPDLMHQYLDDRHN